MSHLGERITDYVLGEMTGAEKTAADAHVRSCTECSGKIEEFQRTFAMLRSVPDVDPPRRIVFETEKRRPESWLWRWLIPAASAATASVLTALVLAPAASSPSVASDSIQPEVTNVADAAPTSSPTDVQAVISQVQESCAQWLAGDQNRDRDTDLQIQRVCSQLSYWESQQRAASRESFDTARSLQLLVAQSLPSEK